MPIVAHRPDLAAVACRQLTAVTSFRLGRTRLAEDCRLSTRQLLRQPNTLVEEYSIGGKDHQLVATITLLEPGDGGAADNWSLELVAAIAGKGAARKPDSPQRPTTVLRLLGKVGLETDFYVNALFVRQSGLVGIPNLPVQKAYAGGAYTHIIGYTLAKVGELGQVLYELNARWLAANTYGIGVGFTYRRTLDGATYEAVLSRASDLVDSVLRAPEPGEPAVEQTGAGEQPEQKLGEENAGSE